MVSSRNAPKVRLLPSTGITRLPRYYEPVRHPKRPSLLLTEFQLRATTSHRRGFPCFDDLLFQACRRHYPDGTAGCCRCLAQRHRPSPKLRRVGFRHSPFRGLLGVHSRFGLPVRSITQGDLYQSTSTHVVTSLRRSDCFRPSDRLAGWDSHPLEIADFHGVLSLRHCRRPRTRIASIVSRACCEIVLSC